jgi:hypothetical protein
MIVILLMKTLLSKPYKNQALQLPMIFVGSLKWALIGNLHKPIAPEQEGTLQQKKTTIMLNILNTRSKKHLESTI